MSKLCMKLLSAFAIGLLAATVGFIAFDGPPLVSAQTATNSAATGAPTISGTARVGQTLTVDTSGIADANGLDSVSYGGTWYANNPNEHSSGGFFRKSNTPGDDLDYQVSRRDVGKNTQELGELH